MMPCLTNAALQTFVDGIIDSMIFDGEQLFDFMAPHDLGWKARTQVELALMADLQPLFTKRAGGPRHLRTKRVLANQRGTILELPL